MSQKFDFLNINKKIPFHTFYYTGFVYSLSLSVVIFAHTINLVYDGITFNGFCWIFFGIIALNRRSKEPSFKCIWYHPAENLKQLQYKLFTIWSWTTRDLHFIFNVTFLSYLRQNKYFNVTFPDTFIYDKINVLMLLFLILLFTT